MVSIIPLTKNILARQKSLNVSVRKAPAIWSSMASLAKSDDN
jgi:hypothetical protein